MTRLACGENGVFYLGEGTTSYRGTGCVSAASGRETFPRGGSPAWKENAAGPGRDKDGGAPWVALLEPDDERGRSLGWAIRQFSDFQVAVARYGPSLPFARPGSEAQLLAAFCALAEDVASSPENRPLVIATSRGRPLGEGERRACSAESEPSLSCELRRLVDHFVERGSFVVAAAGDQPPGRFPAGYEAVVAAGSLDLAWFDWSGGEARASSRTPAIARALFPGHVCLESADGEELWAPAAGSSYAAAVFAGWLAGYLAYEDLPAREAARWTPALVGERLFLARDGKLLPGSDLHQVQALWRRLLGGDPHGCWKTWPPVSRPAVASLGEVQPWESAKPESSDPSPSPDGPVCPCLPCSGSLVSGDFVVDLGETSDPDSCETTDGLAVQIGSRVYGLELAPEALEGLRRRSVRTLVLPGLEALVAPGEELALIWRTAGEDGRPASSSATTILVPDGRDRRLMFETPTFEKPTLEKPATFAPKDSNRAGSSLPSLKARARPRWF